LVKLIMNSAILSVDKVAIEVGSKLFTGEACDDMITIVGLANRVDCTHEADEIFVATADDLNLVARARCRVLHDLYGVKTEMIKVPSLSIIETSYSSMSTNACSSPFSCRCNEMNGPSGSARRTIRSVLVSVSVTTPSL